MPFGADGHQLSQVAACVSRASTYLITAADAREIVDHQIDVISSQWRDVCDRARFSEVERTYFSRRPFLNPYALEGYAARVDPR